MLIASYGVGRDKDGAALCILVAGVFLDGYSEGLCELEYKAGRTNLVQALHDGGYNDGFILPDLPKDVVKLLDSGKAISIIDTEAEQAYDCFLRSANEDCTVGG